ncbi:MAG TPA: RtcB family protein, partial [Burkholderiaceae bacterium]|nr:RtcB family protein [Burkholderiaceae bacterium]
MQDAYIVDHVPGGVPVKRWTRGVPVDDGALQQLANAARLPIVFRHVAAMPDVHVGIGATVGAVIPTWKAIIPAAVGVDIGCGMMAARTTLRAEDLPVNLGPLRTAIERAVPHGRAPKGRDPGAWNPDKMPAPIDSVWSQLEPEFAELVRDHPKLARTNHRVHLGTLGSGNHFIEVCLDEHGLVWFMLHSGSRGVGNAIGTMFIELAKADAMRQQANLPDRDLAYFEEGSRHFADYVRAVGWAQRFAALNREVMMKRVIDAARRVIAKPFSGHVEAVNCHHNYVQREHHFGEAVWVTRKGAVSARAGQLGIIPGSMGTRSYIVRGRGNADSFDSCSHGAGRVMSRGEAKRRFTLADHRAATAGVECRKDKAVIDETPAAYKDIDAVMA